MVINEKGLCAAMSDAFRKKSTGYKVAARLSEKGERELVLSAPGWTAVISRENAPRKVLALIVEHVGDLPDEGMAFHVKDKDVQTEIYKMAVPEEPSLENGAAVPAVKRTKLTYDGHQIWQRTDNLQVFMMSQKIEALLDGFNRDIRLTGDGMFYVEGLASRLHLSPIEVPQNEKVALSHLAKRQWV